MKASPGLFPAKRVAQRKVFPGNAKYQTVDPQKGLSLPKAQKFIKIEDRKHLITTRHMVVKIKQAYDRCLEDLLGISKPDLNTSPTGEAGISKFEVKLFSFLKN